MSASRLVSLSLDLWSLVSRSAPCALLMLALAGCGRSAAPANVSPSPSAILSTRPPQPTVSATGAAPTAAPRQTPLSTIVPTPGPARPPTWTPQPAGAASGDLETQLLEQINALRAEHGLPPYQDDPGLSDAARAHSCDMAAHSFIGHVSSDGRTLRERVAAADPAWVWPSESVAAGTDDPGEVIALWMDEPPDGWHRRNLLDSEQVAIGIGYCLREDDPTGNRHYWTIDVTRRGS